MRKLIGVATVVVLLMVGGCGSDAGALVRERVDMVNAQISQAVSSGAVGDAVSVAGSVRAACGGMVSVDVDGLPPVPRLRFNPSGVDVSHVSSCVAALSSMSNVLPAVGVNR